MQTVKEASISWYSEWKLKAEEHDSKLRSAIRKDKTCFLTGKGLILKSDKALRSS